MVSGASPYSFPVIKLYWSWRWRGKRNGGKNGEIQSLPADDFLGRKRAWLRERAAVWNEARDATRRFPDFIAKGDSCANLHISPSNTCDLSIVTNSKKTCGKKPNAFFQTSSCPDSTHQIWAQTPHVKRILCPIKVFQYMSYYKNLSRLDDKIMRIWE